MGEIIETDLLNQMFYKFLVKWGSVLQSDLCHFKLQVIVPKTFLNTPTRLKLK